MHLTADTQNYPYARLIGVGGGDDICNYVAIK